MYKSLQAVKVMSVMKSMQLLPSVGVSNKNNETPYMITSPVAAAEGDSVEVNVAGAETFQVPSER